MNRQDELLKAVDLVKRFEGVTAVDGASFSVRRGEIFGFLGPNGAGKTTTINLLTGLARPTSGTIYLEGKDYTAHPKQAQALMGIVPDESNLYDELDGFGNLTFCAALYGNVAAFHVELLDEQIGIGSVTNSNENAIQIQLSGTVILNSG